MLDEVSVRIAVPRAGEAPVVRGAAALTTVAFAGRSMAELAAEIDGGACDLARGYDRAILNQLAFRKSEGLALQELVLRRQQVFRVASRRAPALRLLAIMAPGDLMVNAPLDFITSHLDVQLDLLYLVPGIPLPAGIPDHDVAFFAVSEADEALRQRLRVLYQGWPRPALNDPGHLKLFARDAFADALAYLAPVRAAPTRRLSRGDVLPALDAPVFPLLIRPAGSHAGNALARLDSIDDAGTYLRDCAAEAFFVSQFIDYRGADGLFRKYRVAFIDRDAYLCHMAVSEHWMVHYLNAGMTESATKRADEARAMAGFEEGFARRHAAAFDALNALIGIDYYSIDCAETTDGKLLVFEADTGAIIHMMDPPDLFPYKRPQMERVFAAFDAMLRRRVVTPGSAHAGTN
jgi:hypothetical protein